MKTPLNRSFLGALALCGALALAACQPDDKAGFLHGREQVTLGQYDDAIVTLRDYLTAHPDGKYASRASFFIAKAHLGAGRIGDSRDAFVYTRQRYPGSLEAEKSRYKLAFLLLLEGDKAEAATAFREIAENPQSPLAPEAAAMASFLQP